jgi:hypothetical protein|tara:strand:- start:5204 stop:5656 length:453 start_codon:yes stop_codon:yes gene_type:complete
MGYLTTSALKQAFEAALASSLTGYHISRYPHELFPLDSDSRPLEHKAFCVGVLDTVTYVDRARQRPTLGNVVATGLEVSVAYRLRADAMVADYNAGLAAEAELLKAVFAVSNSSLISITFNSTSRQVVGEGTVFSSTSNFRCVHRLQLEA